MKTIMLFLALTISLLTPITGQTNTQVILEDWTDIVTANDLGFSDFAGNSGLLERYGTNTVEGTDLKFNWNFNTEFEAYTGRFFSLFGLTENLVTFDGTDIDTIVWNDYYLNLDNIEGDHIISPYGSKQVESIWMTLDNVLAESVKIKLELSDIRDNKCYQYFTLNPGENTVSWDFRNDKTGTIDYSKCKLFSFIIERRHLANNVSNPAVGELKFHQIGFETDQSYLVPSDNTQLLDLIQFRAFQYFIDYVGRRPDNLGFVQDRATFPDLYSVGGQGFTFAAWIIGINNGWISETWVKERVLSILNELGDTTNYGPDGTGKIGHRGFFYHFLGPDGRRKVNFDWPETSVDESKNTVELSFIDTGLLLWGIYALQSFFADDFEIDSLCQQVINNVDWGFLLDETRQQFYLGWKPEPDSLYSIPANSGGYYSSKTDGGKLLADWYSDEYLLCILAALGSEKHPVSINTWDSLIYEENSSNTIISYPGSLFTYQFLSLFYPTHLSKIANVDWFANSSGAINQTAEFCSANISGHKSYEEGYSGLSACEGPSDLYHAYGATPVAKGGGEDDGTISVYPIVSSLIFPDHKDMAMNQLWSIYNAGYFHKRSGMPDAFHLDVSEVSELSETVLRDTGVWLNRPNFAIDAGPMVIALQNMKDSLIWKLILENPNVQKAIEMANSYPQLEVSDSTLVYGIIATGETESRNITLVNKGERELVISSMTIENPQFKIQNDINFPVPLKKDEVLILDVVYTSTGMKDTAMLLIGSNDHEKQEISIHLFAGSYVMPEISAVTLKHVFCNGDSTGSMIISADSQNLYYSIDSGATWESSNAFINLLAGDYYVLIKDTNEVTSSWSMNPIRISEPASIELKITSQDASCSNCSDGTIQVGATGGIPPYTYSLDDSVYVEDSTFSNLAQKEYTVFVQDSNACKLSENVNVSSPVGIEESGARSLFIYPNPVDDFLTIQGLRNQKSASQVNLLNISGKVLHVTEYKNTDRVQINVSGLQPGVYFIKILEGENIYLSRFIKK